MKYFLTIALTFFFLNSRSQDPKYISMMKESISMLDTSQTPEDMQKTANTFERISGKAPGEWLPYYYMGLANVRIAFMSKKKMIDEYCDKAEAYINKADSLNPNNSEIYVVKAMVTSARISVNPASRGSKYGPMSNEILGKAKTLDPNNPRVFVQQGTSLYYTPKMFGGGKDKAEPVLKEAVAKFATFKPATEISPNWGEKFAKDMLAKCSN
jgi:hypothetical protein